MTKFNVNDIVADITNMEQWRNPESFKTEVFFHAFYKRVLATDDTHFVVRSKLQSAYSSMLMSDYVLFSQSTGLDEFKTRVLFNLTPHIEAIGQLLGSNLDKQGMGHLRTSVADGGGGGDMNHFTTALKDAFLTYFDRLHEEIAS